MGKVETAKARRLCALPKLPSSLLLSSHGVMLLASAPNILRRPFVRNEMKRSLCCPALVQAVDTADLAAGEHNLVDTKKAITEANHAWADCPGCQPGPGRLTQSALCEMKVGLMKVGAGGRADDAPQSGNPRHATADTSTSDRPACAAPV